MKVEIIGKLRPLSSSKSQVKTVSCFHDIVNIARGAAGFISLRENLENDKTIGLYYDFKYDKKSVEVYQKILGETQNEPLIKII